MNISRLSQRRAGHSARVEQATSPGKPMLLRHASVVCSQWRSRRFPLTGSRRDQFADYPQEAKRGIPTKHQGLLKPCRASSLDQTQTSQESNLPFPETPSETTVELFQAADAVCFDSEYFCLPNVSDFMPKGCLLQGVFPALCYDTSACPFVSSATQLKSNCSTCTGRN